MDEREYYMLVISGLISIIPILRKFPVFRKELGFMGYIYAVLIALLIGIFIVLISKYLNYISGF